MKQRARMLAEQTMSVEDWVAFLGKEHMPAIAETVQKLNKLTTDDDSRVSQLTEQVLKDPSLTSRVLQVSNSVVYKGLGGNIKTITRAIVMLGFTTVRDITMSMQILDDILKHNPSQHLMVQIANSYHAAMQAKGLLRDMKSASQEEIFISTLLLHFAEMSMLSRDDEVSRKLNSVLKEGKYSINEAAMDVLGCNFSQISLALAKEWELGDVLLESLKAPNMPSRPAQAVLLGDELSQVAMMGWNSKPVKGVIKKIAVYRDIPFKDALEEVKEMASMAQDLAVHYGAAKVRHLIPTGESDEVQHLQQNAVALQLAAKASESMGHSVIEVVPDQPEAVRTERNEFEKFKNEHSNQANMRDAAANDDLSKPVAEPVMEEGIEDLIEMALSGQSSADINDDTERTRKIKTGVENVQLQMDIMQELNKLIADRRIDVNAMLDLVMDGMIRAIGLERVVMGLVSRDRKKLVPKFFKGEVDLEFKERLSINLSEENAFSTAIGQSQPFWMGSKLMAGRFYLHTEQLKQALGHTEYFVSPIIVSRRPIGVFYGDQALSKSTLNDQQYAGFTMLAQQAGLALTASQG